MAGSYRKEIDEVMQGETVVTLHLTHRDKADKTLSIVLLFSKAELKYEPLNDYKITISSRCYYEL